MDREKKMLEIIRKNLRPGHYSSSLDKTALEEWHIGHISDEELKERIFENNKFNKKVRENVTTWGIVAWARSIGY